MRVVCQEKDKNGIQRKIIPRCGWTLVQQSERKEMIGLVSMIIFIFVLFLTYYSEEDQTSTYVSEFSRHPRVLYESKDVIEEYLTLNVTYNSPFAIGNLMTCPSSTPETEKRLNAQDYHDSNLQHLDWYSFALIVRKYGTQHSNLMKQR